MGSGVMRRLVRYCLIVVSCALIGGAGVIGGVVYSFDADTVRVLGDKNAGFRFDYFLNIPGKPDTASPGRRPIRVLVIPNNTGRPDDAIETHDRSARLMTFLGRLAFQGMDVALLVPVFPRPTKYSSIYTHALDRDCLTTDVEDLRRLDLQLGAMIDDAIKRLAERGWEVDRKVLMAGFSAGGMFVNRFALLHPDRVLAAAIGSPGGWPIAPTKTWRDEALTYPAGIADLRDLVGADVDQAAFKRIPLFFFLGDRDGNDSVPYSDSYDDNERKLVLSLFGETPVARWSEARDIYASTGANAEFRLYPGVEHSITFGEIRDVRAFFANAIAARPSP